MRLEILTSNEIEAIHAATMDVLENAGVTFLSRQAQEILKQGGADVDIKRNIAKIPAALVKEKIGNCPSRFFLYARNPKYNLELGSSNQYMTCGGEYPFIIDLESGARRLALARDIEPIIRVTDALDNISVGGSYMIAPSDVQEEFRHIERGVAHYKNTSKTTHWDSEGYIGESGELGATHNLELAAVVAGGFEELEKRPIGTASICPSSPLTYDVGLTDDTIEFVKHGVPILVEPMDNTGATSPITLAGSLVQSNAAVLAGLVLIQLVRKGSPVVYGSIPVNLDARTGIPSSGCPENSLRCAGGAQMAHYYGLPSAMSGGATDAKVPDVQAGFESAFGMLTTVLAGANWIRVVAGELEYHFTASYEMLAIHDEMFGIAMRIARGITVDDDTLAVPLIKKVAPRQGHYMAEKHTLGHIRSERYLTSLSDRHTHGDWTKAGSKDIAQRARERVKAILATHRPEPLPKDVERDLDAKKAQILKRISK